MKQVDHFYQTASGIGNMNYLSGHIKKLEQMISGISEPLDFGENVHYYSWLLLKSLYIRLNLEHLYLRFNPEIEPTKRVSTQDMVNFCKEKLTIEERSDLWNLHAALELRDRLTHLGLPNKIVATKSGEELIEKAINGNFIFVHKHLTLAEEILGRIKFPPVEMPNIARIG